MTKTEIAKAFSNGDFEKTYLFIADHAEWIVVEENFFKGKEAIIRQCEQVRQYFASVTTRFTTLNVIAEGDRIVINGTAEFLKEGKRLSFVSACDLYEFNEQDQLQKITSYCIQAK